MELGILTSILAGIVIFFAPCTLPILPGYIGYLSRGDKNKIIKNSIFFLLGFLSIFLVFGVLAGLIGGKIFVYKDIIQKIGGVFVIFLGLYLTGLFKIYFLNKNLNFFKKIINSKSSPFLLGVSFASGWTPCVGPVLASIFFLATFSDTILRSISLFFFFSIGFIIPFLALAFFIRYTKKEKVSLNINPNINLFINILFGLFLVFVGILLVSDQFFLIIRWFFNLFSFINYEGINSLL